MGSSSADDSASQNSSDDDDDDDDDEEGQKKPPAKEDGDIKVAPRKRKRDGKPEKTNHNTRWQMMFDRLVAYKQKHGDTNVPNRYPDDPQVCEGFRIHLFSVICSSGNIPHLVIDNIFNTLTSQCSLVRGVSINASLLSDTGPVAKIDNSYFVLIACSCSSVSAATSLQDRHIREL